MSKADFTDGVCDSCGNTGLAGEKCIVCGAVMAKVTDGISDPVIDEDLEKEDPEVYPLEALESEESDDSTPGE